MSTKDESQNDAALELGARLAKRDLSAAPAALNLLESGGSATNGDSAALLSQLSPAALGGEAPGMIVGLTGPPGAGKSTLLSELVAQWRAGDKTVAVLAVADRRAVDAAQA
ncbi:MAG: AAA family ATPase, partial [Thermoleophilaceae bacterium]|nr:AAA family ATPase [Thermoleophilaceae bacterium]